MDPVLPPTPISPHIPLPGATPPSPPVSFDPSTYPPLPDSPGHGGITNDNSNVHERDDSDGDLFPGTAHPIERSTNPLLVPLPPSPRVKPTLPHRRPKGWVSTIADPERDDVSSFTHGTAAGARHASSRSQSQSAQTSSARQARRSSARLPSGPDPLKIGGRTISGVMQYAMRPPSPSPPTTPTITTPPPTQSQGTTVAADPDHALPADLTSPISPAEQDSMSPSDSLNEELEAHDAAEATPDPDDEPYNLDEIRSSVVGLTDQANDEVWMSYVRQQLGTLFPDFFQPLEDDDHHDAGFSSEPRPSNGFGSLDRRDGRTDTAGSQGALDGWAMVQDGAHHRPMTTMRQGEYGSVPNVREEISGLREEIERLRGVVGGLASGLYESGVMRAREETGQGDEEDADPTTDLTEPGLPLVAAGQAEEDWVTKETESTQDAASGRDARSQDEELDIRHEPHLAREERGDCLACLLDSLDGAAEAEDEEAVDGLLEGEEVEHEDEQEGKGQKATPDIERTELDSSQTLPLAFVKTAAVSLDLIRALAQAEDVARGGDGGLSDEAIFEKAHLLGLKERLVSRLAR